MVRGRGRGALTRVAAAALAALVPLVFVANVVYLIAQPWYARWENERAGDGRGDLAVLGLRSIVPWEEGGVDLLRPERLPDGSAAFEPHELAHMEDVRRMLFVLLALHALVVLALALLALRRVTRPLARRALVAGSWVTLGLGVVAGALLLADPVGFLDGFHVAFFSGDSWRMADDDTLRLLYPDRFWSDTAAVIAIGALAQAAAVAAAARLRRPR